MLGNRFSKYTAQQKSTFDKLFELLQELLVYTSGDITEALDWLNQLDREYNITTPEYGMGDFIQELKDRGYLREEQEGNGVMQITSKMEQSIRKTSLDQIFGKLKKSQRGNHKTSHTGNGDENAADRRNYQFGDSPEQIDYNETIKNAHINHGISEFNLDEEDLVVVEKEYKAQTSTVLMIDISHSMILYGEDRITPAKKVAMALSELITTKYPKDTLDLIVFGNDAWQIEIKDIPYLQVGPYHTNTVAGLELAMDLLRRRKNPNKQIFMITDGKPTCIMRNGKYYKNSFGLDRIIVNKTLNLSAHCRKIGIKITTFMIARDPYLQQFVQEFTQVNQGKAFYTSLKGLGDYIFEDYERNRRRNVK
ncbi:MAG: VWA domain-containing protein [Chitinophagales bacterium]|nr:VWA domain-containing protein [Chitinophagales bacterium]